MSTITDDVIATATTFCVCDSQQCVSKRERLRNAIEQALRDERERAVKILNQFAACRDHDQPTHCVECDLRYKAIAAIRKED